MSSDDDSAPLALGGDSSNGDDGDDDDDDDNDDATDFPNPSNKNAIRQESSTYEPRGSIIGRSSRGAIPRASKHKSSKPRPMIVYTAADIDREIATTKKKKNDDSDEDDYNYSNSSTEGGNDHVSINADDIDEKNNPNKARTKNNSVGTTPIRKRKSGYKPISAKKSKFYRSSKKSITKKSSTPWSESSSSNSDDDDDDDDHDNEDDDEYKDENDEDDTSDDDNDDDDDGDSDYGTKKSKTISSRKKNNNFGKTRKSVQIKKTRSNTTMAHHRPKTHRPQYQSHRSNDYSSSYDENDDNDDNDKYKKKTSKRSGSEGKTNERGGRGDRPRRACKTQTELRMSEMVHRDMQSEKEAWGGVLEEDDRELLGLESGGVRKEDSEGDTDDQNSVNDVVSRRKKNATPKKGSKKMRIHDDDSDDDADYDEREDDSNDSSEDDGDDEVVSDDEIISKPQQRRSTRHRSKSKNVDLSEEEIGTADEDSEDEELGSGILMSPARKRVLTSRRKSYEPLHVNAEEYAHDNLPRRNPSQSTPSSRKVPKDVISHVNCPSITDDITMANLPKNKPHVCYISPDGKTRHCFALDTLYRIAISAASNRTNNSGENDILHNGSSTQKSKLTFLQPPHFRSPMEDDLLDQIASRFGREALIIEKSAVYKRMNGSIFSLNDEDELDNFDDDGEFIGYGYNNCNTTGSRRGNFQDRFERFIQNLMGSNDVYCCPLCYNEADRRLGNVCDEEMWEDDVNEEDEDINEEGHHHSGEECFSFLDDPMRILGSLDQDQYEVASRFCFRTLVDVKNHLKAVHCVNIKEVSGNDLYHRFQIRASDGLLQSWLKRNLGKSTVQGDMMRYWLQGENQSFVLLLSQIDKRRYRGQLSGEYESEFCESFPNRARRIWREVSSPYSKDQHDMGDFIVAEGEEESEEEEEEEEEKEDNENTKRLRGHDGSTPKCADEDDSKDLMSPEDRMIEFLQKKTESNQQKQTYFVRKDTSRSKNNSDSNESSDEDELEVLPRPQQYEEVLEEDEWMKSKSLKAKMRHKTTKSTSIDSDLDDADAFVSNSNNLISSARKRVINEDDSMGSDTDEKPKSVSPANNAGSARKKAIESSDDESF